MIAARVITIYIRDAETIRRQMFRAGAAVGAMWKPTDEAHNGRVTADGPDNPAVEGGNGGKLREIVAPVVLMTRTTTTKTKIADFLEHAGDEVRSWFGDEDAERRPMRDHHGRGPKG